MCASQMLEKANAKPRTVGGSGDQARNISHDEGAVIVHPHHPEIRHQRRKRIIRHLRSCGRERADQSGLPRIGRTEQSDLRDHLELEAQIAILTFSAPCGPARRPVGARFEARIADAASTTPRNQQPFTFFSHVPEGLQGMPIDDRGTHGHLDHTVLPTRARFVVAAPRSAGAGAVARLKAKVHEGVQGSVPH